MWERGKSRDNMAVRMKVEKQNLLYFAELENGVLAWKKWDSVRWII